MFYHSLKFPPKVRSVVQKEGARLAEPFVLLTLSWLIWVINWSPVVPPDTLMASSWLTGEKPSQEDDCGVSFMEFLLRAILYLQKSW
jgi:hypothetical protein